MAKKEDGSKKTLVPDAWRRTEIARHPERPYPLDFIRSIFTGFTEMHGDRSFGDDPAVSMGMARLDGEHVFVIANLKGRNLKERAHRRFGMPNPEGYRKALHGMKLAEKFRRPVITILDITAAYPGIEAEERGQGEAIARNIQEMTRLRVPTISVITSGGGSGGALALAVADRVLMLENAIYSVIPPEGCASITWRDASKKQEAAAAMRYTASETLKLGCVDEVIPEPPGGAHQDASAVIEYLRVRLQSHLAELLGMSPEQLLEKRYVKLRTLANFFTVI